MPLQKMTDALQMGPENKKRQDRLEKDKERENAEAGTGLDKPGPRAEGGADATSTAAPAAVGESAQLADEEPTAVGDQGITPPALSTSATVFGCHRLTKRDTTAASHPDIKGKTAQSLYRLVMKLKLPRTISPHRSRRLPVLR